MAALAPQFWLCRGQGSWASGSARACSSAAICWYSHSTRPRSRTPESSSISSIGSAMTKPATASRPLSSSASTPASSGWARRRRAWAVLAALCAASARRTGPCTMRSLTTAPSPRNRFTRARISAAWCWIRAAAGPSTFSSNTAPPPPRGLLSLVGSVRAERFSPAISRQRAFKASGPWPKRSSRPFISLANDRPAAGGARLCGRVRLAARIWAASAVEGRRRGMGFTIARSLRRRMGRVSSGAVTGPL